MNLLPRFSNTKYTQRANAIAVACSILIFLPGCFIPCLRPAPPGPDLPDSFSGRASEDNSSQLPIDQFFSDPTLISLVDQALVGNQQLKILYEDIQIANNEVLARRGAYLPFFSFLAGAGVMKPSQFTPEGAVENQLQPVPGVGFPNPLPNFLIATDLTWQIDIWRMLRNARDAAGLRYLGTIDGRNYVVTRLVAEIADNYFALMSLDRRLENLDNIIRLQEQSLEMAKLRKEGTRGTELPVQRFLAEVRKNQSEKLIIKQEMIETENRINFLVGRYPMPVERSSADFINLTLPALKLGVPSQMLMNRPDIRQAERELQAAGLDIKVARAHFYPQLIINGGVGLDAFDPKYLLMTPESLIGSAAGSLVAPLVNRYAIRAEYQNANAKQLQAVVNYQKIVLTAFTEVINRVSMVENFGNSIEIKKQQLQSLEASVSAATDLFLQARAEYLDVLFAQRDLMDARMVLIDTKRQQLSAIVNTYQALGGGGGGLVPIFSYENNADLPEEEMAPEPEGDGATTVPPKPLP